VVWATAYDGTGGGGNVQEFTKTSDGGLNWSPGICNVQDAGLGISMIVGTSISTAWLAAYPTAGGQTGGIWKTTNGGTSWTRQNTATFNNAASFTNVVHFWDANVGFCQGDPINGEFELYTTTNGGTTWSQVPGGSIPNPTNGNEFGYTRQIDVIGDHVWFSTSLGRIYHSANKGLTWNVFNTPVADFGGAVTAGTSANFSFSSANDGLIIDNSGTVYRTTNGGTNWSTVTTTGSVFTNGLCFIEGTNTAFCTGAATGVSGSSYSTDGGTTWNIIDTEQHLHCEFTTPSIGWSGWFNVDATTAGMWKWNDLSSSLVADFSGTNTTTCSATPVVFADLTTGGTPTTWLWTFPGGTPATSILPNPSVTYSTPGTYDVTLTVGDGISQTTYTQTAFITSIAPATVPSSITGALVLCELDVETYTVVNDPNVVYNWTIPAGWSGTSTTNSITVTAGATGGNVEVNAENICGSSANSQATVVVNLLPVPVITATGTTTICSGSSVDLTSSYPTNNVWSTTETSSTITVSTPGPVTVIHTDVNGCSNTSLATTIIVNNTPVLSAGTITGPNACGASTGSIQVTGSGTGDVSWTGTATGNANNVTLPYTIAGLAAGSYNITIVDGNGCTSNILAQGLNDPNPPATPVISAGGAITFCDGGTVDLTSSYGSGNSWSTTETTSTITVTTTQTISVTYVDGFGCSSTSTPTVVTVNANPSVPAITATGALTFCDGGSVDLSSSQGSGNDWSTTETSQTITVTTGGPFTVTYTDGNGCSAISATTDVVVNPLPTIAFPALADLCDYTAPITLTGATPAGGTYSGPGVTGTTFDPAAAGLGTHTITYSYTDGNGCANTGTADILVDPCVSIAEQENIGLSIFPNPTTNELNIELNGDFNYEIVDARGRNIVTGSGSESVILNTTNYETGVYFVTISNDNNTVVTRVVKQ
ncbi:MAG: T9SS type A sorting domain-containing protein, partial [Crocinitomicaceae bacterium]|nr:T9SS type A sorting domain-containing protein [Crocinitomicaceae bacterium]